MEFRGHLRLPEDAGTGIPVLLRVDDIFVVISSGDDELGAWRADDVAIERIFSNQFSIELDGESMVFLAHDALGFAYDGVSAIEDLQERLTKRRVFKRSKKKPKQVEAQVEAQVETASASGPAAETSQEPVSTGRAADEDVETPAAQSEAEPADEPVLAGEPNAIWAPPSASPPPPEPQVATEPDIEIAVPEPVRLRVDAEPSVPADVRVSYPEPAPPPPPAVETFLRPTTTTPEADTSEPLAAAPIPVEVPPPSPEPQSTSERAPAEEPPPALDPASVPSEESDAPPVADEPEYEIEEVSAASTGGTWADDAMVGVEPGEPKIEIEEYVVPTAAAAEMFTAPAPHDGGEPVAQQTPEHLTEPELDVPEGVPTPGVEESVADDARPAVEGRHLADDTEAPAIETTVAEEAVASNGHSKTPKSDVTQKPNKRERRHSLFGRSQDKKTPAHEHEYGEPKTIGGLKRQVCEVCGHVTFSGEDVYQGW